jgi:hypothetical protein
MTSTIDVFEAFTKLAPNANPKDVKTITDYMEENRRGNVENMKEIFMTKDDKIELIEKIGKVENACVKWYLIATTTQTGIILAFLYFMLKK